MMELDTETVRRLRDALLDRGAGDKAAEPRATEAVRQASSRRVAPLVETMYLVMMADGAEHARERSAIAGAIRLLTRGILSDAEVQSLLEDCESNLSRHGVEARLQLLGARISANRQDAETAFTLAAAIALADDAVDASEHDLVGRIAEWYGLSARRAGQLIEAL
jgi:tellurite resistance protein